MGPVRNYPSMKPIINTSQIVLPLQTKGLVLYMQKLTRLAHALAKRESFLFLTGWVL